MTQNGCRLQARPTNFGYPKKLTLSCSSLRHLVYELREQLRTGRVVEMTLNQALAMTRNPKDPRLVKYYQSTEG